MRELVTAIATIVAGGEDAEGKVSQFIPQIYESHWCRTLYRREPRTTYSTAYMYQFGCCAGYSQSGSSCQRKAAICMMNMNIDAHACTIAAVCNGGCQNGGICEAPNRCDCRIGWTGTNCGEGKKQI